MAAVIRYASTASREGKAVLALATLGGTGAVSGGTATPLSFEISTFEIDGSRSSWSVAERLPYDEESLGALITLDYPLITLDCGRTAPL